MLSTDCATWIIDSLANDVVSTILPKRSVPWWNFVLSFDWWSWLWFFWLRGFHLEEPLANSMATGPVPPVLVAPVPVAPVPVTPVPVLPVPVRAGKSVASIRLKFLRSSAPSPGRSF
jgi:hypothetical protein